MSTVTNYYQCCGHCGVDEPFNCGAQHTEKCCADGCKQGQHLIKTVTKSDDGTKTKGITNAPYKEPQPAPRAPEKVWRPAPRCCGSCYDDPDCECNMWEECDCPSVAPSQKGSITLKGSWGDPLAFTPDFLGIPDPPPQPVTPDQPAPTLSPDKQALLDELLESPADDPVNHPKHYTDHPSGVECIQITEWMGFNLGNAMKYIWRADLKGNDIQDLEKASWYLGREIERRKNKLGT